MSPIFLKLKYENLLIIKNDINNVVKTVISLCRDRSKSNLLNTIKESVTNTAPSGHGRPIKKSLLLETLKRASLNSTDTKYKDAIITPSSNQEFIRKFTSFKNHWYKKTDGATPKETTSAKLSYWAPKSLVVFVILATLPSRPSNMKEAKIKFAAIARFPPKEYIIETKPHNTDPVVNKFGIK